jgi:hypothetical protein
MLGHSTGRGWLPNLNVRYGPTARQWKKCRGIWNLRYLPLRLRYFIDHDRKWDSDVETGALWEHSTTWKYCTPLPVPSQLELVDHSSQASSFGLPSESNHLDRTSPSMATKRKAHHIESKSELHPSTSKLESTTDGIIRQHGRCLLRANTKQFSTMCFVCTKGRSSSSKEDQDMCRFEGVLNN